MMKKKEQFPIEASALYRDIFPSGTSYILNRWVRETISRHGLIKDKDYTIRVTAPEWKGNHTKNYYFTSEVTKEILTAFRYHPKGRGGRGMELLKKYANN